MPKSSFHTQSPNKFWDDKHCQQMHNEARREGRDKRDNAL